MAPTRVSFAAVDEPLVSPPLARFTKNGEVCASDFCIGCGSRLRHRGLDSCHECQLISIERELEDASYERELTLIVDLNSRGNLSYKPTPEDGELAKRRYKRAVSDAWERLRHIVKTWPPEV